MLEAAGLVAGRDFDLAFAPERDQPGRPGSAARDVPRLVGGLTPGGAPRAPRRSCATSTTASSRCPRRTPPRWPSCSRTSFRNVNIALVNQLALLCERMGLDVWEVIDAAATKPFGFMRFTPGPGVGGHCIPVDPYYLAWRAREFDFVDRFVELAGDINLAMPRHVVDLWPRRSTIEARRSRAPGRRPRRRVQAQRAATPATRRRRRIAGLAGRAAPRSRTTTRTSASSAMRTESCRREHAARTALCRPWTDVIVIVTAHRAIDWDCVFDRADAGPRHGQPLGRPGHARPPGAQAGCRLGDPGRGNRAPNQERGRPGYLIAIGFTGDPTAPVIGSGGALKKNS